MRKYFLTLKNWVNIILLIPCWVFSTEIGVKNSSEYWYWTDSTVVDSTGILENNTSLRWKTNYLDVGTEILYLKSFYKDSSADSFHITGNAEVNFHNFSFLAGDFYQTIGNGLILGMEPIEEKQEERRIRGYKFDSDIKGINFSGLWGVPYVIDRLQKRYRRVNDTSDVLMGLDFSLPDVSVRGLRIITEVTDTNKYTDLLSEELNFQTDLFSFDMEIVQKRGWDKSAFEESRGVGSYIMTTIDAPQNWVLTLQFIKYYNLRIGELNYKYNWVPIVNKSGYSITDGKNESGFAVGVGKTFNNFVFDVSHSRSKKGDENFGVVRLPYLSEKEIIETYFGVDLGDWKGALKSLHLLNGIESDFKNKHEVEWDMNGVIRNIELGWTGKKVAGEDWRDTTLSFYDISASVGVPVKGNFIVYTDYMWRSEEMIIETKGTEWYGLGVKCEFFGKMNLDVWSGKEKGGLICSGGTCRQVTPFEGFKVKLTVSF